MQAGEHFLQTLKITQQATATGYPAKAALDDPALGQDHKAFLIWQMLDHHQLNAFCIGHRGSVFTGVAS